MSQFDEIVKNIALENEKCNYNPEKGTNWEKLGWQEQFECLKHMDFKTRIRLSQTCSDEQWTFDLEFRDFECIVKTIASESKKCNYNPEKDTNWCNLPMEMRYECLKRMDFTDRCRLRQVSKTEKSLIESRKHDSKFLRLLHKEEEDCDWSIETDSVYNFTSKPAENTCIPAIFKLSRFDLLLIKGFWKCGGCVRPMLKQLVKFAPFQFKRLAVFDYPFIAQIMKHCVNLEKIDFHGDMSYYSLKKVLENPNIMKVKEFRCAHTEAKTFNKFLKGLVQKWIDNDAEVGKSVQFYNYYKETVKLFASKFADRIIEKTDKEVRIRMNNKTTQILFRHIGSVNYGKLEFCSCKVVPIDMPKSEYATGDGWIQTFYENLRDIEGTKYEAEDEEIWRFW